MVEISNIIEALHDLEHDGTVPRNVKAKISITIQALKDDKETSLAVSKALSELEEVADDSNLQSFTRTQIWNIVSMLEKVA